MSKSKFKYGYYREFPLRETLIYNSYLNHFGHFDSIRHLLFTDNFKKPYSHEHILVHPLTIAFEYIHYTFFF